MDTKRCPACAEEILAAAVKCKHCGSSLVANPLWRRLGLVLVGLIAVAWSLISALVVAGMASRFSTATDASLGAMATWGLAVAVGLVCSWMGLYRRRRWSWALSLATLGALVSMSVAGLWTRQNGAGVATLAITGLALFCVARAGSEVGAWRTMRPAAWAGTVSAVLVSLIIIAIQR